MCVFSAGQNINEALGGTFMTVYSVGIMVGLIIALFAVVCTICVYVFYYRQYGNFFNKILRNMLGYTLIFVFIIQILCLIFTAR